MMYRYLTLNDGTEVVHSDMMPDGRVKVFFERPDERDGSHDATCHLPDYAWESVSGFSDADMERNGRLLAKNANVVAKEYARRRYLYDPGWMFPSEQDRFQRLTGGAASETELAVSLSWLSMLLRNRHGSRVVILIDEYDTPVNDAHLHGFRHKVLGFYRSWLSGALKGTVDLYCAAFTGVLRVSRESIFSELNNVQIDTTLDDDHAEAIGFTAAEAEALAAHAGRAGRVAEMAEWCDGYRFGNVDVDVYNPWSVLNYLRSGQAQPYWTNTSRNGIVTDLIRHAGEGQTAELAALAGGGAVAKPLDLRTVFDDLGENPGAVWAQLYQAGYVTTRDTGTPNDSRMPRGLYVPNLEARELYSDELLALATRLTGSAARVVAGRYVTHCGFCNDARNVAH